MISKFKKIFKTKKTLASVMTMLFSIVLFNPLLANASEINQKNIVVHKEKPFDYSPLLSPLDGITKIRYIDKLVDNTGEEVFCLEHGIQPPNRDKYKEGSKVDSGVNWIIKNYYTDKEYLTNNNDLNYYITYKAIHVYLGQENFKVAGKKPLDPKKVLPRIYNIANKAKTIKNDNAEKFEESIKINSNSNNYKFEDDKFISPTYSISESGNGKLGKINLSVSNKNAKIISNGKEVTSVRVGDKFNIEIPASTIKNNEDITVSANAKATHYYDYAVAYSPVGAKVQKIAKYVHGNVSTKEVTAEATASVKGMGKIEILKVDEETGKKLEGAQFEIKDKITGKVLEKVTTNKDGVALSSYYKYGTQVVIKETKAPKKYTLNGKEYFATITENMKTIEITVANRMIKGSISVHKADKHTNKPLAGVEFNVLDSNNKVVDKLVTDENGNAKTKILNCGEYKLVETKTNKYYKLNSNPIVVNIAENKDYNYTIQNEAIPGKLLIKKTDITTGKEIEGAKIQITCIEGSDKGKVIEFVSGKTAKEFDLKAGKYTYKEVQAPAGYELNKEVGTFEITEQGQVVKCNVKDKATTGKLLIKKVDIATGKEIEGAKIKITCIEGLDKGKVIEFVSGKTAKEFDLKAGKYTFEEVQAPAGYELNKEVGTFEITKEGQVIECSVKDKAIEKPVEKTTPKVELPKTGYEGAIIGGALIVIAGVVLVLRKKSNK